MKEMWGKKIEKLIQKEVWITDPIITLVQNFYKDYTAVARGTWWSRWPCRKRIELRQSLYSEVSSNFVVAQSHTWDRRQDIKSQGQWEIVSKGANTSRKRHLFYVPANDTIAKRSRAPVTPRQRSEMFMIFHAFRKGFAAVS